MNRSELSSHLIHQFLSAQNCPGRGRNLLTNLKNMAPALVFSLLLQVASAYRLEASPETNSILPAPLTSLNFKNSKFVSSHLSSNKHHGVNKDIKVYYQSGVSQYYYFNASLFDISDICVRIVYTINKWCSCSRNPWPV